MTIRKDIKTVRSAVLTLGDEITVRGAGADKTFAYAALLNSYCRLLKMRNTRSKAKADPYLDGDPDFHRRLLEE